MKLSALAIGGLACFTSAAAITSAASTAAPTATPAADNADKKSKKTTLTYYTSHYVTASSTKTITTNSSYLAGTVTFTKPYYLPDYVYNYTGTTTSTYTSWTSTVAFVPAPTTTSVGHVKGFKPIKSASYYQDPITVLTTTVTVTPTVTYDPSPTPYSTYVFGYEGVTTISTQGLSTYYVETTVTSTSTIAPAVRTRYADCGSQNIVAKTPLKEVINSYFEIGDAGENVTYTEQPEDCCNECFSNPLCVGGAWMSQPEKYLCFMFTRDPTTANNSCDINNHACAGFNHYNGDSPGPQDVFTVFNGPDGGMLWDYNGS